jgi:hypothetical protein
MDHTPRMLFAMARAGLRDGVLTQHHTLDMRVLLPLFGSLPARSTFQVVMYSTHRPRLVWRINSAI